MKVLKFGGTSMANASSIAAVANIVKSNKDNKFIVVSAPGKRESSDIKVTDLLYDAYKQKKQAGNCNAVFSRIEERFDSIIKGLNLNISLTSELTEIKNNINSGATEDYVASRGEFLSAKVFAAHTGFEFVDATELICFDRNGKFNPELTNKKTAKRLSKTNGAIIPGFYGVMPDKTIKTFSRGGSDITGSIIARAVSATVYENWTDVDGFLSADPRVVASPTKIDMLTYKELRELSYMGASVLHSDSIFPLRKHDIPIHIKNTFNPNCKGTFIVPTKKFLRGEFKRVDRTVTGIAGKKTFIAIYIEKSMMNDELGFARKVLSILEKNKVSLEQMPSGIDTLTVLFDGANVSGDTLEKIRLEIEKKCTPNNLQIVKDIALIAVVGHGMNKKKGTAARVCFALSNNNINIRLIDQGSSELNIIVGVEAADYEKSIRALYDEFKESV